MDLLLSSNWYLSLHGILIQVLKNLLVEVKAELRSDAEEAGENSFINGYHPPIVDLRASRAMTTAQVPRS
jgi:hypothetical protein